MKYVLLKSDSSKTQSEMQVIGIYNKITEVPKIKGTELTIII